MPKHTKKNMGARSGSFADTERADKEPVRNYTSAIVVAGVSCNPVHSGHLATLDYATNELRNKGIRVAAVYIAVAPDGYCKEKYGAMSIPGKQRLEMVNLLAKEHPLLRPVPGLFGSPSNCGECMLKDPKEGHNYNDTLLVTVSGADRADRVASARKHNKDPKKQWIICPREPSGENATGSDLKTCDISSSRIREALSGRHDDWEDAVDAAVKVGLPTIVGTYMKEHTDLAAMFGQQCRESGRQKAV